MGSCTGFAAGKLENTSEGVCKLESLVRVRDSPLASPMVRQPLDSSPETRQYTADDVTQVNIFKLVGCIYNRMHAKYTDRPKNTIPCTSSLCMPT